ncbi:DUF1694 domain-containing protein [Halobacillus fulvus]|nr:DUF1694 domain-containing protein [Halobacillus fulvus]
MKKPDVDDYLQEGIYGTKETKPGERKRFLGTLRERIVVALTKGQVMQKKGLDEVDALMKEYPNAKLLLNGEISSRFYKPYRTAANKHGIRHTTVYNQESDTDIGAVLALDEAIEKEEIWIDTSTDENSEKEERGIKGFFKSLFKPVD